MTEIRQRNSGLLPAQPALPTQSGAGEGAGLASGAIGADKTTLTRRVPQQRDAVSDVAAKAKAAADQAIRDGAAERSNEVSLAIPGVPTNQDLPVTVSASITLEGTARVLRMTDDATEMRIHVKGSFIGFGVERDITLSLAKQADGTYLYQSRDAITREVGEGVAKDIVVERNVKKLKIVDKKTGEESAMTITDMGNGRFKIAGDGFVAEINKNDAPGN